MTEKIDIAAFRAGISTEVDNEALRRRQEAVELRAQSIFAAECSPGGVILLLTVARLGTVFENFPDTIPLGEPDDGINLVRGADGVWHVEGKSYHVRTIRQSGIHMRNTLLGNICDAIDVDRTLGMDKLETIARIHPSDIGTVLLATRRFLPDHTFRSILAAGKNIRDLTGPGPDIVRDAVTALVTAGIDINASVGDRATPLISAAADGDNECIEALLASGADIDIRHNGWSALQHAVANGHSKAVETLLEKGASQEVLFPGGIHLLHLAADLVTHTDAYSAGTIIDHLLDAGADPTEMDYRDLNVEDRFRHAMATCLDMVGNRERTAESFDFKEMDKIATRLESAVNAQATPKA